MYQRSEKKPMGQTWWWAYVGISLVYLCPNVLGLYDCCFVIICLILCSDVFISENLGIFSGSIGGVKVEEFILEDYLVWESGSLSNVILLIVILRWLSITLPFHYILIFLSFDPIYSIFFSLCHSIYARVLSIWY